MSSEYTKERCVKKIKWKVKYELRAYHETIVEAFSPEEAEAMACEKAYPRHKDSIHDITSIEPLEIIEPTT